MAYHIEIEPAKDDYVRAPNTNEGYENTVPQFFHEIVREPFHRFPTKSENNESKYLHPVLFL